MYLPFTKPVWSGWMRFGSTDSSRLAIAFAAILQSTFNNVIGLQFGRSSNQPSSIGTRSPQGLYNWAACDVTNPNLSPLLSLTFQVISGTSQIFRLLNPRDKKRYYATQYSNFSVTLLRYGLKILTDSWIEGNSLGYPDHPPRRCHPGRQPTFIHFFTNTLKCLHGRLAG